MITLHYLRHATMILTIEGKKILIDPMLAPQHSLPPVPLTANRRKNPLTPLPVPVETVSSIDAVLLTHYHFDHFDKAACNSIPKAVPVFCQPGDDKKLLKIGFTNVRPVFDFLEWNSLRITRVDAVHGKGLVNLLMGKSSSFIITCAAKTLYITGDALYDNAMESAITKHAPDFIITYAGEAKMLFGKPITLNAHDVLKIKMLMPEAEIIAVHMNAINHCRLTQNALKEYLIERNSFTNIRIPVNGELLSLA